MSDHTVLAQNKANTILLNGLRSQRISHAYIFSGPAGTGKRKMAMTLAQSLLCAEQQALDPCGRCPECRKVEHGNHPLLHIIQPDGNSIKIDQIRELQRAFTYRYDNNQRQIYIIEQAEQMTTQAANSLLKFLEEPQSGVTGILISDNGQALLPTIRSRSQWIPFYPESPQQIEEVLVQEGYNPHLARTAAHLRSGTESARELAETESFAEMRNVVIQLGRECMHSPQQAAITSQRSVFKGELSAHVDMLLDLWTLLMKDMVYVHCGRKEELIYRDQADWLVTAALNKPIHHWVDCVDRSLDTRRRLRLHVQPQLAWERLLFHT